MAHANRDGAKKHQVNFGLSSIYEQFAFKDHIRKQCLQRILAQLDVQPEDERVANLDGNFYDPLHVVEIMRLRPQWVAKMFVVRRSGVPPQLVVGNLRHAPKDGVFAVDSGEIGKARDLETFLYVYLGLFPDYVASDLRQTENK